MLKPFTTEYRGTRFASGHARSVPAARPSTPRQDRLSISLPMNAAAIAAELDHLASRARCLPPPSHARPEAFHEARSELGKDIAAIAKWLKTGKRTG